MPALRWLRWLRRRWWLVCLGAVGVGLAFFAFLWLTLPNVTDTLFAAQSTVITDRRGVELYRLFSEQDRTYVSGDQIPQVMKDAIVAIEDRRFYSHPCIDLRAIARSVYVNVIQGSRSQGASTLAQQLARTALLSREKTFTRKMRELLLACQLEWQEDKQKILELYLNWIPFGQNAYGVEQASRAYFGHSASGVTLAQAAVLASLPQRPSYFNPYGPNVRTTLTEAGMRRLQAGLLRTAEDLQDGDWRLGVLGQKVGTGAVTFYVGGRSDQVLQNMLDQGFITDAQRQQAQQELSTLTFKAVREDIRAPHFVLWVRKQVEAMLEASVDEDLLEQGGLTIETTLDWELQQLAEKAVADRVLVNAEQFGAYNAALVALNPETREVLAYVGNADYSDEEHDGKVDMARVPLQPGSSFKPLVFTTAFLRGYGPATVLHDLPFSIGSYKPQNFDGRFWGLMSARQALASSRNIPAIKAYYLAGEEDTILDVVSSMGAPTPKARKPEKGYGPALSLGAAETPLLEMVQAYATLADGGKVRPVVSIVRITDRQGAIVPCPSCLNTVDAQPAEQVLDPRIAYQVTSILSDESVRPTEFWKSALSTAPVPSAAKTGTSNQCFKTDGEGNCIERKPGSTWTMGYTPRVAVGVWVGNADYVPLASTADGLTVAAPIWNSFVRSAHPRLTGPEQFVQPEGMSSVLTSTLSGELPTECTPIEQRRPELFLTERVPMLSDPACLRVSVDRVTQTLASPLCPPEAAMEDSFYQPYTVLADRWPQWVEAIRTWAAAGSGTVLHLAPTETCDPALTPGRLDKPTVRILSPKGSQLATAPTFRIRLDTETATSIREVRVSLDGREVLVEDQPPFTFTVRVPKSLDLTKEHTLTVTVSDRFYNTAMDTAVIRFGEDEHGPQVRFTTPDDGQVTVPVGGTLRLEAEADDPEGGLKLLQFYLDDILLTNLTSGPFRTEFPLTTQLPGRYRLRVVAKDQVGNEVEDVAILTIQAPVSTGSVLPGGTGGLVGE
jgi:membrane peptidoglycan carboxypeptidase